MSSPSCLYPASTDPRWWTYTTRIEKYQRIARNTSVAAGPWDVTNTTGTTFSYFPRNFQSWETEPYAWDLAQAKDTLGNTVSYTYGVEDNPDSISYNGTVVKFYYELRPDIITYANGRNLTKERYRLKTIDITVGGLQVRAYKLTYLIRDKSTSRSMLFQVQQYGNDVTLDTSGTITGGTNLPPMTFTATNAPAPAGSWLGQTPPHPSSFPLENEQSPPAVFNNVKIPSTNGGELEVGDFTGTGHKDLATIWFDYGTSTLTFNTEISQRSGGMQIVQQTFPWPWSDLFYFPFRPLIFPMDLNGDKKTDFLFMFQQPSDGYVYPVQIIAAISDGTGHYSLTPPQATGWFEYRDVINHIECKPGDANGDGKTDLICTYLNYPGSQLTIGTAISKGDGSFDFYETPMEAQTDYQVQQIAVGDVNGDGMSDLMFMDGEARGSIHSDIVTAFSEGFANGFEWVYRFARQRADFDVGDGRLYAADINGDGKTDLVFLHVSSTTHLYDKIETATTQPDGSFFIQKQTLPQSLKASSSDATTDVIAFGDFNGDGKADLMIARAYDNNPKRTCPDAVKTYYTHTLLVRVPSNGDGTFALPATWDACQFSREIDAPFRDGIEQQMQLADMNGDGLADFVGFWNNGTNVTFVEDVSPGEGLDTFDWKPADNGDGKTDLVYVASLNPGVRVYTALQQSDGTYTVVAQDYFMPNNQNQVVFDKPNSRRWMTVELLRDGRTDLAYIDNYDYVVQQGHKAVRYHGIRVYTLLSQGDGTWEPLYWDFDADTYPQLNDANTTDWLPMDVNGDGLTDLVQLTPSPTQNDSLQVNVLLADQAGGFTPVLEDNAYSVGFDAANTQRWMPADVNGDGKFDLVSVSYHNPGLGITTLLSKGDGHWYLEIQPSAWPNYSSPEGGSWRPMDVNGDGKMDLVHLGSFADDSLHIDIMLSAGNGYTWIQEPGRSVFGSKDEPIEWGDLNDWRTADVNSDGRSDLVHMMNLGQGIRVDTLLSNGEGEDGFWQWQVVRPQLAVKFSGYQPPGTPFWKPFGIDRDGTMDFLRMDLDNGSLQVSRLLSLAPLDLLTSVTNGVGATTRIYYNTSSAFPTTDLFQGCFMPVGVGLPVVTETAITWRNQAFVDRERYSYGCAHWSYRERGLLSWGRVIFSKEGSAAQLPSQTVDSYDVSDSCLVRLQSTELVDGSGNLYNSITYNFVRPVDYLPYQCQVALTNKQVYNQASVAIDDETWNCYDAFGNIIRQFEAPSQILLHLGDNLCSNIPSQTGPFSNLGSGLLRTTLRTYHPAVGPYIVSMPAWEGVFPNLITDASLEKPLRSAFYCYDNDSGFCSNTPAGPVDGDHIFQRSERGCPHDWHVRTSTTLATAPIHPVGHCVSVWSIVAAD
jgi:hypothetical protein